MHVVAVPPWPATHSEMSQRAGLGSRGGSTARPRPVDEAAMQAKLRELRDAMTRETAARETARGLIREGGGRMWQSSRPAALRVRNGGPKLRELTADELEQIQRAKDRAAEVERAAVLAAAAAGRARTRSGRRLEPLDLTLQPSTSGPPRPVRPQPQPDPSAVRRSHADLLPRPTSASRRPGSAPRGGSRPPSPRVEHVVIRAYAHPDVNPRRGHPPAPAPAPPPGSRPSSARPISARAISHFDDDACDLIEPMGDPIVPAGSKAAAASFTPAATTTATMTRTGVFADDDDEDVEMLYVAPEWERARRGDADVWTLGVSSSSANGGASTIGASGARAERRTTGGARVVNETPSLLDGEFDEEANRREFEAALREWRSGGDASPSGSPGKASPGTKAKAKEAAAAGTETQTEAPGGSRRARPETAKPIVPRAGASYFERLYANNVERMAAKDAVDAMGDKRR